MKPIPAASIARWRICTPAAISSAVTEKAVTIPVPRSGSTTISAMMAPATSRNGLRLRRSRVICGRSARMFAP